MSEVTKKFIESIYETIWYGKKIKAEEILELMNDDEKYQSTLTEYAIKNKELPSCFIVFLNNKMMHIFPDISYIISDDLDDEKYQETYTFTKK